MLFCVHSALEEKTAHSYEVHELLYNPTKSVFHYIKSYYTL
jgi:hypothetical protein